MYLEKLYKKVKKKFLLGVFAVLKSQKVQFLMENKVNIVCCGIYYVSLSADYAIME